MNDNKFTDAEQAAIKLRNELTEGKDDSEVLMVAAVFAMQAQHIWREHGGKRFAAKQFYGFADIQVG